MSRLVRRSRLLRSASSLSQPLFVEPTCRVCSTPVPFPHRPHPKRQTTNISAIRRIIHRQAADTLLRASETRIHIPTKEQGLPCGCRSAEAVVVIDARSAHISSLACRMSFGSDQRCRFIAKELDLWAYADRMMLDFNRLGRLVDGDVHGGYWRTLSTIQSSVRVSDAFTRSGDQDFLLKFSDQL